MQRVSRVLGQSDHYYSFLSHLLHHYYLSNKVSVITYYQIYYRVIIMHHGIVTMFSQCRLLLYSYLS